MPPQVEFVQRLHDAHFHVGRRRETRSDDLFSQVDTVAAERLAQAAGAGDGIAIDAEIAQEFVGIRETAARERHIHYELAIPGCLAGKVESAGSEKRFAAKER